MVDPDQESTVTSQLVYEGRVVRLRLDTVRLPDGRASLREVVEHRAVACVVALDSEDMVLLVRQYRKAMEASLLEIPAGSVEDGEDPINAAHRELQEETGWTALEMVPLSTFYMSPGHCTEVMHAFLATQLSPGPANPDEDENIQVFPVSLADAYRMVMGGEIKDGKTIASLLMVIEKLRDGRLGRKKT